MLKPTGFEQELLPEMGICKVKILDKVFYPL